MKDRISARQMEATIALFLIGSSLITGSLTEAKQDTWICMLLAVLLNIPLLWIQSRIIELYPGRDYFENIIKACGKPVGKAICAIILLYSFHISALVTKTFCAFIQTVNMPETPFIFILICIALIGVYVSKKRIHVVARIAGFALPFLIVTVVFTVVLACKDLDFSNMKPFLHSGLGPMAKGTLLLFTLPFGESVLFAPLFYALDQKEKVFPVLLKGMLIGFGILLIANLRNLLILGSSESIFLFPSYEAVSVIKIGDFFTRIEVVIGFNLLLAGFIKVCVAYFTSCQGVAKVLGFDDYVPLLAPCVLILITMAMLVGASTEEMMTWLKYHAFYSLPFQVLLPLLVLITSKIRKRS